MKTRSDALRAEAGFTIIEVMVAIVLLLLGVLGVAKMADQANTASTQSKSRVGATNVARELLEDARTFAYSDLQGILPAGSGMTDLQTAYANAGVSDASGATGFQVRRRGVTYDVSIFTCVLDDPHDGVRAAPASGPDVNSAGPYCLGSPAAGSGTNTDANPDDSRKIEASVSWVLNGLTPSCKGANQTSSGGSTGGTGLACVTQSELIANPSGGLGPAIKSVVQDTSTPGTIEAGTDHVQFNVTTASPAQSLTWRADDGRSGAATAAPGNTDGTQWTFTWGTFGASTPVDGTHIVTVQAFLLNAGGVPKDTSVKLNRYIPAFPTGGTVGLDRRLNDAAVLSWSPNSDQDIFGYTVYRASVSGTTPVTTGGSPDDTPVCSTTNVAATLCFDAPGGNSLQSNASSAACSALPVAPPPGDVCINYYVVPFDSRSTSVANPTSYGAAECGSGFPWGTLAVPSPPVAASRAVAPITDTSSNPLWPTARMGCPSAFITLDYTALAQNHAPDPPTTLTCGSSGGQPVINWTPPASPDQDGDDVAGYRIYRDPPGGGGSGPNYDDPAVTIGFNEGSTNSYTDSTATGTTHDYWITAVDDRFAESNAQHIVWTAGGCP